MPVLTPLGLDSPFPFSLIEGLPEEIYTTYVEPPEPDVEVNVHKVFLMVHGIK